MMRQQQVICKRKEYPEYPEDAYREAVVNAVVHRDYFNGDEIAVEKLKSSIIINNKGGLLFDKKKFGKISEQRNRLIADLLSKTNYMEKVGTGIKRINTACKQNNNKVKFDFDDSFWIQIYSNKNKEIHNVENGGLNGGLNDLSNEIKKNPGIKAKKLSENLKRPIDILDKQIKKLVNQNLIGRRGSKKTGGYFKK